MLTGRRDAEGRLDVTTDPVGATSTLRGGVAVNPAGQVHINILPDAALSLNFLDGKLDPRITFTRTTTATYFDQDGILRTAAINAPRFDHDPTTLQSLGLLLEESRINSIRNNTMAGAVAGTPGTLPTNWSTYTVLTGLTREIVDTGTESGIEYIDIKLSGTPSGAGSYDFNEEGTTTVAGLITEVFTASSYVRLVAGSLSGVSTVVQRVGEFTSGGLWVDGSSTAITPTSASLRSQQVVHTRTITDATTAYVNTATVLSLSGAAIDMTLRIGLPQLEKGASVTSVIKTSSAAVTRASDFAAMTGTNFSSWYNQSEGAFVTLASSSVNPLAATYPRVIAASSPPSDLISQYAITGVQPRFIVSDDGVSQMDRNVGGTYAVNTPYTMAFAYKLNDCAAVVDGGTVQTDNTVTIPTAVRLDIGHLSSGTQHWNGHIAYIDYYATRLPNADLQLLTSGDTLPFVNGFRVTSKGALVVTGMAEFSNYLEGLPRSKDGSLCCQADTIPGPKDPYVGGIRVGPLGGVYTTYTAPPVGDPPVNTVLPDVTGDAKVGSTLTCSDGTWTGAAPITYTYKWYQGATPIIGANTNTYVTQAGDLGSVLICAVTATNALGSNVAVSQGVRMVSARYDYKVNAGVPSNGVISAGSAGAPNQIRVNEVDLDGVIHSGSLSRLQVGDSIIINNLDFVLAEVGIDVGGYFIFETTGIPVLVDGEYLVQLGYNP